MFNRIAQYITLFSFGIFFSMVFSTAGYYLFNLSNNDVPLFLTVLVGFLIISFLGFGIIMFLRVSRILNTQGSRVSLSGASEIDFSSDSETEMVIDTDRDESQDLPE
jgi:hypothetical protein